MIVIIEGVEYGESDSARITEDRVNAFSNQSLDECLGASDFAAHKPPANAGKPGAAPGAKLVSAMRRTMLYLHFRVKYNRNAARRKHHGMMSTRTLTAKSMRPDSHGR